MMVFSDIFATYIALRMVKQLNCNFSECKGQQMVDEVKMPLNSTISTN